MYESISVVGERGQITIPKIIRNVKGINAKDEVIVKVEKNKIVVEKNMKEKEKGELMKEFYVKYAKENEELSEELSGASGEVLE